MTTTIGIHHVTKVEAKSRDDQGWRSFIITYKTFDPSMTETFEITCFDDGDPEATVIHSTETVKQ